MESPTFSNCSESDFPLTDDIVAPFHTQQETFTYGSEDEICVFPDPSYEIGDDHSPYSIILSLAKELGSILEGNCTTEKLCYYEDLFSSCITKEKAEIGKIHGKPKGRMISSSIHSNKKFKSHGTKHMTYS